MKKTRAKLLPKRKNVHITELSQENNSFTATHIRLFKASVHPFVYAGSYLMHNHAGADISNRKAFATDMFTNHHRTCHASQFGFFMEIE